MSDEHSPPGGGTVDRLTERLDRATLRSQSMTDGGEVFRGRLATRALDALGARAMTVDETIIVGDSFNASRIEDQALYAHERHHVDHGDGGGGGGGHNFRDAEEIAARAAEAMVFHRSAAGGYESGVQPGAGLVGENPESRDGQGSASVSSGMGKANESPDGGGKPCAARGYRHLRKSGYEHLDVVDSLVRKALSALEEKERDTTSRLGRKKAWI